ncbi:hypothetical protein Cgig2_000378 [Carnegiea gigantea]|uniref:Uncharacterized protein n=1 Tax=Carnegiea gigantea TaxID=171969 RepID=A0A9Q1Q5B5_9CARY|nr:hypothetical protein Cgig2_000378 [Carnegiea gigantea]
MAKLFLFLRISRLPLGGVVVNSSPPIISSDSDPSTSKGMEFLFLTIYPLLPMKPVNDTTLTLSSLGSWLYLSWYNYDCIQYGKRMKVLSPLHHSRQHLEGFSNHLKETITDDDRLRRIDFAYFTSICSSYISYRCEDHFDIPIDLDFNPLPSSKDIRGPYRGCIHYKTGSKVLFPNHSHPLGGKVKRGVWEWCARVFSPTKGNPKRERGHLFNEDVPRDEGPSNLKPKLKIVHSRKPSGPSFQQQKTSLLIQRSQENIIFMYPNGAKNVMDILYCDLNLTECMGESGDVNFKERLAPILLPLGSHCFPYIEHLSPLG